MRLRARRCCPECLTDVLNRPRAKTWAQSNCYSKINHWYSSGSVIPFRSFPYASKPCHLMQLYGSSNNMGNQCQGRFRWGSELDFYGLLTSLRWEECAAMLNPLNQTLPTSFERGNLQTHSSKLAVVNVLSIVWSRTCLSISELRVWLRVAASEWAGMLVGTVCVAAKTLILTVGWQQSPELGIDHDEKLDTENRLMSRFEEFWI